MIDTHAHIYLDQFREDLEETLERSKESGVNHILMPNIDHSTIDDMLEVEEKYHGYCTAMIGLHPCSVKKNFERELYLVEEWLNRRSFVAVGEIGTDLYWDNSFFDYQKEAFQVQVDLATERELPVVIHCRDSLDQTLDLLEPMISPKSSGVFHCFTGNFSQAERIIALGFKMGIGGVVTFKNSGLDRSLINVPLEHLVLETDSPYLSPAPYRGKRNEPGYLLHIVDKLAEVYNISPEKVKDTTSENAKELFNAVTWNIKP